MRHERLEPPHDLPKSVEAALCGRLLEMPPPSAGDGWAPTSRYKALVAHGGRFDLAVLHAGRGRNRLQRFWTHPAFDHDVAIDSHEDVLPAVAQVARARPALALQQGKGLAELLNLRSCGQRVQRQLRRKWDVGCRACSGARESAVRRDVAASRDAAGGRAVARVKDYRRQPCRLSPRRTRCRRRRWCGSNRRCSRCRGRRCKGWRRRTRRA